MKIWSQAFALAQVALLLLLASTTDLLAQTWGDGMYHEGMQQMMWGGHLPSVSASGNAIVDSVATFGMMDSARSHLVYFIDSSGNGLKRYQLFFGPYWYNPPSGAQRPLNGQSITVRGGLYSGMVPPVLSVYQINGQVWRDSTGAPPWGGLWVKRSSMDSTRVYCGADSLNWISMPPGAMGSGMMGGGMMMWPDSMFMDFDLMMSDSLPYMSRGGALVGFHMIAFNPAGTSMMQGGMMGGQGMMSLQRSMQMRIYVHPDTLLHHGVTMSQMKLQFLDVDSTWKDVPVQVQDLQTNVITANQSMVSPYIALTVTSANSVDGEGSGSPTAFGLAQNYPNPFNPSTMIRYALPERSHVSLTVFNTLGQKVATLVNGEIEAGYHEVRFEGSGHASGVYFYRLQVRFLNPAESGTGDPSLRSGQSFVQTRKLLLVR